MAKEKIYLKVPITLEYSDNGERNLLLFNIKHDLAAYSFSSIFGQYNAEQKGRITEIKRGQS